MNKFIFGMVLIGTVLLSGCVSYFECDTYTQYLPFSANAPENCYLANSEITVINGIPSFEYICNKGEELQEGSSRSQYLTGSTPYKWPVSTEDIIFIGGKE
ncbi:hypothetical protein [Klebsiella phage phiKp_21]|nr:putative outer membrane lipoprotein [Klebsiella phage Muenster]BEH88358.1 hypothetical protein [Klebsiella phage phiKp_21]